MLLYLAINMAAVSLFSESQGIDWNPTIDFMPSKSPFCSRTRRAMKGAREKYFGKSVESTFNPKVKLLRMIKTISGVGTKYVNLWYRYWKC